MTPGITGPLDLAQPIDSFDESGSFFTGLQAGYSYMLPNRFVVGAEVDASFPSFPSLSGISIGGSSTFPSPLGRAVGFYRYRPHGFRRRFAQRRAT